MRQREHEVLLVEDDPADAELTKRSLQKHGKSMKIVHARDGAEALDYLFCRGDFSARSKAQMPRAVLLDLKLPRVSGHEVLRTIKSDERTRCIPVIVMSSSNYERDLVECYRGGVNNYIQKPVDLTRFQEAVKQFGIYWLAVNHAVPENAFPSE